MKNILEIKNISATYRSQTGRRDLVLNQLSLDIRENEFLGLLGQSGSGKTTLAKILAGFLQADVGEILFEGQDLLKLSLKEIVTKTNAGIQMVFQNPYESFNPIQTIGEQLEEALIIQKKFSPAERKQKVLDMIKHVGLDRGYLESTPAQLSGGQLQRVAIGAALIVEPRLLLADEAVSSLDVSVQAQILDLFKDLRKKLGFACLFISHDLAVVQFLCDRIAILNEGKIIEIGDTQEILENPQNDYTKTLIEDAKYLLF